MIAPEPAPAPAVRRPAPDTTSRSPDTAGAYTGATGSPVEATGGGLAWLWGAAAGQRVRLLGAVGLGVLTETCTVGLAATAAWLIVRAAEQPSFADLAVAAVGVRAFAVDRQLLATPMYISFFEAENFEYFYPLLALGMTAKVLSEMLLLPHAIASASHVPRAAAFGAIGQTLGLQLFLANGLKLLLTH